jgi:hypothetical protein
MAKDTTVEFYTTVAFDIPLVAMLISTPVMAREDNLWNVSVLSSLVQKNHHCFYNHKKPINRPCEQNTITGC